MTQDERERVIGSAWADVLSYTGAEHVDSIHADDAIRALAATGWRPPPSDDVTLAATQAIAAMCTDRKWRDLTPQIVAEGLATAGCLSAPPTSDVIEAAVETLRKHRCGKPYDEHVLQMARDLAAAGCLRAAGEQPHLT